MVFDEKSNRFKETLHPKIKNIYIFPDIFSLFRVLWTYNLSISPFPHFIVSTIEDLDLYSFRKTYIWNSFNIRSFSTDTIALRER